MTYHINGPTPISLGDAITARETGETLEVILVVELIRENFPMIWIDATPDDDETRAAIDRVIEAIKTIE